MSIPYPKHSLKVIILITTFTVIFTGTVFAQNEPAQTNSNAQLGMSPAQTFNQNGNVNSAAWSPDGDLLMTWLNDPLFVGLNTVQIWHVANGVNVQTFNLGTGITSAAWSPDQSRILTTTNDGGVHIWDIESGQELHVMSHEDMPWGGSWVSAGDRILTWSADATARLWDAESGQELHKWQHEGPVGGATLNPDERRVLTWSADGAVVVWERESGQEIMRYNHDELVLNAVWSPDGNRVMSVGRDYSVRVADSSTGNEIYNFEINGTAADARWNADGSLILARANAYLYVWDAMTGEQLYTISPPRAIYLTDVQWTPNETHLAIISSEMIWVYDAENAAGDYAFNHDTELVREMKWSSDEAFVLSLTSEGTAYLLRKSQSSIRTPLQHSNGHVNFVGWSPDETQIVTTSIDGIINIWQTPTP